MAAPLTRRWRVRGRPSTSSGTAAPPWLLGAHDNVLGGTAHAVRSQQIAHCGRSLGGSGPGPFFSGIAGTVWPLRRHRIPVVLAGGVNLAYIGAARGDLARTRRTGGNRAPRDWLALGRYRARWEGREDLVSGCAVSSGRWERFAWPHQGIAILGSGTRRGLGSVGLVGPPR